MTIVDLIKEAITNHKRLDVVIGDGIDPRRELHTTYKVARADLLHKNPNKIVSLDRRSWGSYEHVRHFTTNARPSPAYDLVLHLARKDLLRSVITTNYDTTLDSMFLRFKNDIGKPVLINPILTPGEWDHFGYCSERSSYDVIEFWKIHGSLNHIFCRKCKTLLKCPDFVLPFNIKEITDEFNHPISHVYIPGKAACCPIPVRPEDIAGSLCGHYVHPTDWNIPDFQNIEPFKKIIAGAIERLRIDTFGVIIIGFKGNKSYEEINGVAENLDRRGVKWVMYLCDNQKPKVEAGPDHYHLRDIVINNGGEFKYYSVGDLASKLKESITNSNLISLIELSKFDQYFNDYYINQLYWERL